MAKSLASDQFIIKLIPSILNLMPRKLSIHLIEKEKRLALKIFGSVPPSDQTKNVRVPELPGIDPEMREWSLCEILEHNAIVNCIFTRNIESLENNRKIQKIDPKLDVLPKKGVGVQARNNFITSIEDHLHFVKSIRDMRKSKTAEHAIFGKFNAHQWHSFLPIHLSIHRKQMKVVLEILKN